MDFESIVVAKCLSYTQTEYSWLFDLNGQYRPLSQLQVLQNVSVSGSLTFTKTKNWIPQ